jgi:hypothetical protein
MWGVVVDSGFEYGIVLLEIDSVDWLPFENSELKEFLNLLHFRSFLTPKKIRNIKIVNSNPESKNIAGISELLSLWMKERKPPEYTM